LDGLEPNEPEPEAEAEAESELDEDTQHTPGQIASLEQRFAAIAVGPTPAVQRNPKTQRQPTKPAKRTPTSLASDESSASRRAQPDDAKPTTATDVLSGSRRDGFGTLLVNALRKSESDEPESGPTEIAAAELARETYDVVTMSDPVLIRQKLEGQAAGLAAHFKGN
jgi:hypothetical protein